MAGRSRRPCKVCGADLNQWGPDRKGLCPSCAKARRDTVLECAGNCGEFYSLREMSVLSLRFEPGKTGGKKFTLYYCESCLAKARRKVCVLNDEQQTEFLRTEKKIRASKY
jgi:hypothetical protein